MKHAYAILIATFLLVAYAWQKDCYTGCAEGCYGCYCEELCNCRSRFQDCDDSPMGSGRCLCHYGQWHECGEPSPLSSTVDFGQQNKQISSTRLLQLLQVDNSSFSRRSRKVDEGMAVHVIPQSFNRMHLVVYSDAVAQELGLTKADLEREEFRDGLGGKVLFKGAFPFANSYGGHQFGRWAGQLGDGRAVQLGEIVTEKGERGILLKGSGRTAFSRAGDGRATLSSALREFLGSLYLNAIGVPTVSALAVVGSCDDGIVLRDPYYDGRVEGYVPGILTRVSPSWLRFGSIQLAAERMGVRQVSRLAKEAVRVMFRMELDYGFKSIGLELAYCDNGERSAIACMLEQNVVRLASLVAAWMSVGFTHGVMNTDNMSLVGLTMDLNVFGWVNRWRSTFTPNFIDSDKRYSFGSQRKIAKWNLFRLADVLTGNRLLPKGNGPDVSYKGRNRSRETQDNAAWLDPHAARRMLSRFDTVYDACYMRRMLQRLGLPPRLDIDHREIDHRRFIVKEFITTARQVDYFLLSGSVALLGEYTNTTLYDWVDKMLDMHCNEARSVYIFCNNGLATGTIKQRLHYIGSLLIGSPGFDPSQSEKVVPKVYFRSRAIESVIKTLTHPQGHHRLECNFTSPDLDRLVNALSRPFDTMSSYVQELVLPDGEDNDFHATCGAQ